MKQILITLTACALCAGVINALDLPGHAIEVGIEHIGTKDGLWK